MAVTGEMVRRQLRLAGRSAKVLVRHPAVGRELPRLAATRGRSTMRLRLPWLPFRLIDELASVVGPGSRVFEYGGGGSTLWFLDQGAEVTTVEHHDGWADELEARISSAAWTLLRRSAADAYADYVAAIDDQPDGSLDVVVVDGRERARCARRAVPKVRPGGLLLVDDIDRDRYRAAVAAIGWPRRDVVGFAPAKPTLAYTAVLQRPAG
jgi:predicted O-methyltransferase YrrM